VKHIKILLTALTITACATGGDVVKITTVENSRSAGIGKAELAKLESIRKAAKPQAVDPDLRDVIDSTPHFTTSEYLARYSRGARIGDGDYKVGGYDVLNIIVYEEKDLSRKSVRVSSDGYISFPLIGRLRVRGRSTSEIESLLSLKLAQKEYVLNAHVSIMVTEYNSQRFLVLGAAARPGSYALRARERVLDGISRASGVDFSNASKNGMIIRTENTVGGKERKIVIDLDLHALLKGRDQVANIYLEDKDILFISAVEHFYIIGQVKNPGSYAFSNGGVTLVQAISKAGGFTQIASRNKTRIIRVEKGVEKIINVKVDAITRAGKKIQDVIIRPDDIIIVPESFF
jgi:polysaccharide biosynthesis/export protein